MKKVFVLCLTSLIVGMWDLYAYEPGTHLLKRNGNEVRWGQSINEDKSCSPSYNYLCPEDDDDDDQCGHTLAGCGAVAMAQIMYKWAYPEKSKYNSYDWSKIPAVLTDGCSLDCPRLIKDCGTACNMHYQKFAFVEITGSWTTIKNIAEGFADFDYGARVVDLDDWRFGSAWADLIRSEIDCGRPVLMHGKHNIIDISERHYFVIDGYSKEDKDKFHVNWGWRGYKNGYTDLEGCGYSNGQKIIVGIAPKHTGSEYPAIKYSLDAEIMTPNCPDGIFDKLRYKVENADSYECLVFDRTGKQIWACAGLVKDGYADMWDGSANTTLYSTDYWYDVTFKNDHGGYASTSGHITYFTNKCPDGYDPTPTELTDMADEPSQDTVLIYPNPSTGIFSVSAQQKIDKITVHNVFGSVVKTIESPNKTKLDFDLSDYATGCYYITIETENSRIVKPIIKK